MRATQLQGGEIDDEPIRRHCGERRHVHYGRRAIQALPGLQGLRCRVAGGDSDAVEVSATKRVCRITDDRAFGAELNNHLFDQYLRSYRKAEELIKP